MILYPQLPHPIAEQLASERRSLSIAEATKLASDDHPQAFFTPTGGSRATTTDMRGIRIEVLSEANRCGFPDGGDDEDRLRFDRRVAAILKDRMSLIPAEAAKAGMWEFLSCVLFCDVLRWRFPGGDQNGTAMERFLSGRRNTFQRLWWRGFVFRVDNPTGDPYSLLNALGEDEIVQIMERPFLAGNGTLSQTIARELVQASERYPSLARRLLIREVQKKLRRLAVFSSFEILDEPEISMLVRTLLDNIAASAR